MKAYEQRAAAILRRLGGVGSPKVAEIGVAFGNLSEELLRKNSELHLLMVDSWKPEDEQPEDYKDTLDNFSTLTKDGAQKHKTKAIQRTKPYGRAKVMHMTSAEAAKQVEDESLDLVFIDADHSYSGVKADIEAWWPKVKRGGWISGHDYANTDPRFQFDVERAVDEFCTPELDLNFTWFHKK